MCALVLAIMALFASGLSFDEYIVRYRKTYKQGSSEYLFRKNVYEANLFKINQHNNASAKGWSFGINHFSDMDENEFKRNFLGYSASLGYLHRKQSSIVRPLLKKTSILDSLPKSVDWRQKVW